MKQLTAKSTLGEFAGALDPQYQAPADVMGAARLVAALATKSQVAQDTLNALQQGAAEALRELGYANAAKDAANAAALAEFAPAAFVPELDDEEGAADTGDGSQIVEALDAIVETTKSVQSAIENLDARMSAMENRTGVSFGRDWDDEDADALQGALATKSASNDLWAGSAFANVQA